MSNDMGEPRPAAIGPVRLGLRANWPQFAARRITDGSLPDGTPRLSPHGGQAPQPFRRRNAL